MMENNKYQRKAARRRDKEFNAGSEIYEWCEKHSLDFTAVQTWQLRVRSKELIIDIYPLKQRYHNVTTNVRGGYTNSIEFLQKEFNIPTL